MLHHENASEMHAMSKRTKPAAEGSDLFRRSVGPIKTLAQDTVALRPPPPPAVPVQRQRDEQEVLEEMLFGFFDGSEIETGEELLNVRPGVPHGVLRKLRRGQLSIEAELDLHGMTVPVAKLALAQFLHRAVAAGKRCVRVVHGKGYGSPDKQPVLKGKTNQWLRQREEVLAFCSARPADGGTGAVYVLLRRQASP